MMVVKDQGTQYQSELYISTYRFSTVCEYF
jgi:hypothetical protein